MATNTKANSSTSKKPCSLKKREDMTKKKQFCWNADMVEKLITCLHNYKSQMECKNINFDDHRSMQYTWVREEMTKHFQDEENLGQEMFGPIYVSVSDIQMVEMTKEEKAQHMKVVKRDNENIKKAMGE